MRPLPSAITNTPNRCQNHDDFDTLSQPTTVAPLDCYLTTESRLRDDDSIGCRAETSSGFQSYLQKRTVNQSMQACDCSSLLLQPDPTPSSAVLPNAEQDKSLPSTPVLTSSHGPDSEQSMPSSPGDLSSAAMSEDTHSLSASLSEFPASFSPIAGTSPTLPRAATPQLVMPSLNIPQRRPFSETGRALGKLKVLVTGRRGIGKTSLILAIAQSSAHIVHMDTFATASNNVVTHAYASTRPKPWWKTYLDHDRDARRRRRSSTSDEVLDRNICFVDCPADRDDVQGPPPAVNYVESRLAQLIDKSINDPDLCALLSEGAEPIVDVALYLLPSTGPTTDDIDYMRGLQNVTNVIPLLARADELSTEECLFAKNRILRDIDAAGLDCFSFAAPGIDQDNIHVHAISSATKVDSETIDASILMKSDYLPPLVVTDLDDLVKNLLSVEGSTWLRHSAAYKSMKWLRQQRCRGRGLHLALTTTKMTSTSYLTGLPFTSELFGQQDQARIEIASWAEGLRQSLATERSRQHTAPSMSITRRHLTLTKRNRSSCTASRTVGPTLTTSHQDPLGLLELVSQLQTGGKLTLELISSFGVLGCVAAWVIQPELVHRWDVIFGPCLRLP